MDARKSTLVDSTGRPPSKDGGIILDFGLLWRDNSLDADAGDPGARDVKTGSFPSILSLPDLRPELRAELGALAELEPEA